MKQFARLAIASVSVLTIASATVSASAQQRAGGVSVSTAFVEEEIVSNTSITPGAIVAPAAVVISALRSGEVSLEALQIGAFVRAGTKIAEQNTDDLGHQKQLLALQIKDATAQLAQTKQNLLYENSLLEVANAQLDLLMLKEKRARQLVEKKAISVEAAESTQAALLNAKQQIILRRQAIDRLLASQANTQRSLDRLNLQVSEIERNMADATYRAPITGRILELPRYQSGFARQGDVLARLQGFDGFEVEAEIPSQYLSFVRSAKEISASDGRGTELKLTFRTALPEENRRTSTRPVRFAIEGDLPRALFANGARVDIQMPIREATNALLIPQDAVVPVAGGHVVYVYDDGKAARQVVRLGGGVGDKVIVLSGLAEGERVITKGNEGLSDGTAVKEGTPPKRKVPSGEEGQEVVQEAALETELAADAVTWALAWSTPRGDSSAELVLSSKANLYDGEPILVQKDGDKVTFAAENVLPFGILTFTFDGVISGQSMSGTVTLSGLPNGRTPSFDFTGSVQ